jgi:hypothetical protein
LSTWAKMSPSLGGIYLDSMNREQQEYRLDRDLTETLLLGYSAPLRRKVLARLRELEAMASGQVRLPTTAEAFASVFSMVADQERRQFEQDRQIKAITADVQLIKETAPLTAKPQNTETITEARKRIGKKFGLPARIINVVMGELAYSPRVFAMVKNSHEDAKGSSYAVWRIIDVTKLFYRFVGECRMVTATQATHPDIEGRFKLIRHNK